MNTTATATYDQAIGFDKRSPFSNLVRRFRAWRSYRRTVVELNKLSDLQLQDLGLMRADISETVASMIRAGQ